MHWNVFTISSLFCFYACVAVRSKNIGAHLRGVIGVEKLVVKKVIVQSSYIPVNLCISHLIIEYR